MNLFVQKPRILPFCYPGYCLEMDHSGRSQKPLRAPLKLPYWPSGTPCCCLPLLFQFRGPAGSPALPSDPRALLVCALGSCFLLPHVTPLTSASFTQSPHSTGSSGAPPLLPTGRDPSLPSAAQVLPSFGSCGSTSRSPFGYKTSWEWTWPTSSVNWSLNRTWLHDL